jgi:tetratricopeptide (TPR) repeat protein
MRRAERFLIGWLAGGSLLISAARAEEPPAGELDAVDWPAVIAKLRQHVSHWPSPRANEQLAIAYNNYGISLGEQKQWDLAIQQLEEAVRLDGGNAKFRENLGRLHLGRAHEAHTQHRSNQALEALRAAVALDPNLPEAYLLMGEIEYGRQRLKEAKAAWQRAKELDPSRPEISSMLDRVSQELPVESKFDRLSQAYFDLRYEDEFTQPVESDVRDALLEARRLVGSDFAYWPKYKIVVLLYSPESFRALRAETPEWVAGQFDGKIRIPVPGRQLSPAEVKRIIFHEYTHAVIHDLTGGRCPTWLNEGLAEYEGRRQLDAPVPLLAQAYEAGLLTPWSELSGRFSFSVSAQQAALAYEEAYSIARYLVERYGLWRVRRILKAIAEGRSWDAAMVEELRVKIPKIEAGWNEWLREWLR